MAETKSKAKAKSAAEDPAGELVTAKSATPKSTETSLSVNTEGFEALKPVPLEFTVRGRTWHLRQLPAVVMLDLALLGDDRATDLQGARAIHDFLESAIVKSDAAEWAKFLRDSDPVIELEELTTMIQEILEVLTGRPTTPS